MKRLKRIFKRSFLKHPQDAGETYLSHLWFTARMALWFVLIGLAIILHGIFPFLFTSTASSEIRKINAILKRRVSATQEST